VYPAQPPPCVTRKPPAGRTQQPPESLSSRAASDGLKRGAGKLQLVTPQRPVFHPLAILLDDLFRRARDEVGIAELLPGRDNILVERRNLLVETLLRFVLVDQVCNPECGNGRARKL
jgi:hypothetical protein